jgi:predicted RNA-binding Zn-ribbon protein involved in translation (DUF1610 family)
MSIVPDCMQCYSCGASIESVERVGRRDVCESCGYDLHSCRNCRFYDVASYNECREAVAERVVDKEEANFCDYFEPADLQRDIKQEGTDHRRALEDLFKK